MKKQGLRFLVLLALARQLQRQADFLFSLVGEEERLVHYQPPTLEQWAERQPMLKGEPFLKDEKTLSVDRLAHDETTVPPAHWLQRVEQLVPASFATGEQASRRERLSLIEPSLEGNEPDTNALSSLTRKKDHISRTEGQWLTGRTQGDASTMDGVGLVGRDGHVWIGPPRSADFTREALSGTNPLSIGGARIRGMKQAARVRRAATSDFVDGNTVSIDATPDEISPPVLLNPRASALSTRQEQAPDQEVARVALPLRQHAMPERQQFNMHPRRATMPQDKSHAALPRLISVAELRYEADAPVNDEASLIYEPRPARARTGEQASSTIAREGSTKNEGRNAVNVAAPLARGAAPQSPIVGGTAGEHCLDTRNVATDKPIGAQISAQRPEALLWHKNLPDTTDILTLQAQSPIPVMKLEVPGENRPMRQNTCQISSSLAWPGVQSSSDQARELEQRDDEQGDWPSLPVEEQSSEQSWRAAYQHWERQQRIDDEQRGTTWNG